MEIFPAVHYSMGGIWTDYTRISIISLLAIDDLNGGPVCSWRSRLSVPWSQQTWGKFTTRCIYTGLMMGPGVVNWHQESKESAADLPSSLFEQTQLQWQEVYWHQANEG